MINNNFESSRYTPADPIKVAAVVAYSPLIAIGGIFQILNPLGVNTQIPSLRRNVPLYDFNEDKGTAKYNPDNRPNKNDEYDFTLWERQEENFAPQTPNPAIPQFNLPIETTPLAPIQQAYTGDTIALPPLPASPQTINSQQIP